MKHLILMLAVALSINAFAQDADKTVTLVVSGQGKTQDEAKQVALRSAIEQAFGAFISSKTEILNDKLVKDEIVSLANGNIEKYDIVSEIKLPDQSYANTLKVTVSVSKLTSFCEVKGVSVEFKGNLFAANIKMQKINEENEYNSIKILCNTLKLFVDKMFDFNITSNEPKSADGGSDNWDVVLTVGVKINNNFDLFSNFLLKSLKGIALNEEGVENYKSLNKNYFKISLKNKINSLDFLAFRNEKSLALIQDLTWYVKFSQANFILNDGIEDFSIYDHQEKDLEEKESVSWSIDYKVHKHIFKLHREYESKWDINDSYNGCCYGCDFKPLWGTLDSDEGCTYELSKLNVNEIRRGIIEKISADKEQLAISKEYNYNPDKLEEEIQYCNKVLTLFSDSSTVFLTSSSSGQALNGNETIENDPFRINLNPNSDEAGKYYIRKRYTTENLSKISMFTVKSGKIVK